MLQIRPEVLAQEALARTVRRQLHQIPEPAFHEFETQKYLLTQLREMKPDKLELLAGTGIKAVFYACESMQTVAIRADMDALPIREDHQSDYISQNEGLMHACGHDAHMTMALLTAKYVSENRNLLKQNVVFLFQPGEEGAGGAKRMIACGALENPHVDYIYGMHVFPGMMPGQLGVCPGVFLARSYGFDIQIKGKASHAAHPDLGVDAISAAAELIVMMQQTMTHMVDPMEQATLHVGSIHGGERRNVVCDCVTLCCTLRTFSDDVYERITAQLQHLFSAVYEATGAVCTMKVVQDYPMVVNSETLTLDYLTRNGDGTVPIGKQVIGEDFAYYLQEIPGLFVLLGIGDTPPLHSSNFHLDEKWLLYGVESNLRILFTEA